MQRKVDRRVRHGDATRIRVSLLHMHQDTPRLDTPSSLRISISTASMASLSFNVGILGNIASVLVYLAPIGTFWRVIKKKSTENFKGLPYITALLATSLWTFYGMLKPGGLLVATVNGIGAFIHVIYVVLYIIYAPKELKLKSTILIAALDVVFPGAVISVALLAVRRKFRLIFVGVLCAGVTIGRYGSPLSIMRNVVKTKSTKYMPFFLSFFLFINAGVWTTYSVLVQDYYLGVPNAIGLVLGLAQLILYAIYRKKSEKGRSEERNDDDDSPELWKREVEMRVSEDEGKARRKNQRLSKGRSLPNSSMSRQYSIKKMMKTVSFSQCKLHSSRQKEKDAENGDYERIILH